MSSSSNDGEIVAESAESLLAQARQQTPTLTMHEYALARVMASEVGGGTPQELVAIGDVTANLGGVNLFRWITDGTGRFGKQGQSSGRGNRQVSSRQDPGPRHIVAALSVLRPGFSLHGLPVIGAILGNLVGGPARGFTRGATKFFSPRAQGNSCTDTHPSALSLLKRWTYDLSWKNRATCELGSRRGLSQREWVGPIAGIDAYRQMLFRPATGAQDRNYELAKRVIESRGADQPAPEATPIAGADLVALLAIFGGLAVASGGLA